MTDCVPQKGGRNQSGNRQRVVEAVRELIIEQDIDDPKGRQTDQMLMAFFERMPRRGCDECGSSLADRRRDTRFCGDKCRMRHRRRN